MTIGGNQKWGIIQFASRQLKVWVFTQEGDDPAFFTTGPKGTNGRKLYSKNNDIFPIISFDGDSFKQSINSRVGSVGQSKASPKIWAFSKFPSTRAAGTKPNPLSAHLWIVRKNNGNGH